MTSLEEFIDPAWPIHQDLIHPRGFVSRPPFEARRIPLNSFSHATALVSLVYPPDIIIKSLYKYLESIVDQKTLLPGSIAPLFLKALYDDASDENTPLSVSIGTAVDGIGLSGDYALATKAALTWYLQDWGMTAFMSPIIKEEVQVPSLFELSRSRFRDASVICLLLGMDLTPLRQHVCRRLGAIDRALYRKIRSAEIARDNAMFACELIRDHNLEFKIGPPMASPGHGVPGGLRASQTGLSKRHFLIVRLLYEMLYGIAGHVRDFPTNRKSNGISVHEFDLPPRLLFDVRMEVWPVLPWLSDFLYASFQRGPYPSALLHEGSHQWTPVDELVDQYGEIGSWSNACSRALTGHYGVDVAVAIMRIADQAHRQHLESVKVQADQDYEDWADYYDEQLLADRDPPEW